MSADDEATHQRLRGRSGESRTPEHEAWHSTDLDLLRLREQNTRALGFAPNRATV